MLPFLEEVVLPEEVGRLDYCLLAVVVVVIAATGSVLELVVAAGWPVLEQQPSAAAVEAFAAEVLFAVLVEDLPSGFVALEIGCNPIPMIKSDFVRS